MLCYVASEGRHTVDIHGRSPVLAELETSGTIRIAGAMYYIDTGLVDFFA